MKKTRTFVLVFLIFCNFNFIVRLPYHLPTKAYLWLCEPTKIVFKLETSLEWVISRIFMFRKKDFVKFEKKHDADDNASNNSDFI